MNIFKAYKEILFRLDNLEDRVEMRKEDTTAMFWWLHKTTVGEAVAKLVEDVKLIKDYLGVEEKTKEAETKLTKIKRGK